MLRIGTFARIAGVSAKTLRDYDELGLFRPAWVDPATAYRAYSPAQLPQLRRILALRSMGIGLPEIERLVSGGADLRDVLDRRRAELERERREIDHRLAALDIRVDMADGPDHLDVVVRPVGPEPVAMLPGSEIDLEAQFYALEAVIRDLGVRARRPPGALVDGGAARAFVPIRRSVADPRIVCDRLPARPGGDRDPPRVVRDDRDHPASPRDLGRLGGVRAGRDCCGCSTSSSAGSPSSTCRRTTWSNATPTSSPSFSCR